MRDKGIDYFKNSRRATYVQQQYAFDNSLKFARRYSKDCWGITASDGPGPDSLNVSGIERQFFHYLARECAVRAGRRHDRAMGRRVVATIRAGDRVASNRLSGASSRPKKETTPMASRRRSIQPIRTSPAIPTAGYHRGIMVSTRGRSIR